MLTHIVNLLKCQVRARVESGFPERVLNLCGEYGIVFWDLEWESAVAFTFTLARRDWKRLRKLSKNLDCQLKAVGWRGAPFFLGRLRRRYGLWVTLLLCALCLFYGSFFIWDFSIEGNERVSEVEILRALEKHGVAFGSFGYGVHSFQLRNDLLLELEDLSYIAVNVRGCRAYVQVRERVDPPEIISRRKPGNTVAAKDALITAIQPWDGQKMVLPGTVVARGDLLISGVVESDYAGARYLRGMGQVYGETWYSLTCKVPLQTAEIRYTGEERSQHALILGKNRINLYFNSSAVGDTYDKMVTLRRWSLPGDIPLPVWVETARCRAYTLETRERSTEEALALADLTLSARLYGYLQEGEGTLLDRELHYAEEDGVLVVTLTAHCEEQIGQFVELPTPEE